MTEPTDADRKHAAELIWHTLPREQVEAVARALAEERERGYGNGYDNARRRTRETTP